MDQSVLAGVGNVYRSEVLFRHRLSPFTEGRLLKRASWRLIWDDLVRLMPLGVTTGRIVTLEDQVLTVEAALGRGEVPRLTERSSSVYKQGRDAVPRLRVEGAYPGWSPGATSSGAAAASAAAERTGSHSTPAHREGTMPTANAEHLDPPLALNPSIKAPPLM